MKKKSDPRHQRRIKLVKLLFTFGFQQKEVSAEIKPIIVKLSKIDAMIQKSAPGRPIKQINRIDLTILRLAVFELIIKKDTPPKVVIDEAIELGKEFGSQSSPGFINGALGKLLELKGITT